MQVTSLVVHRTSHIVRIKNAVCTPTGGNGIFANLELCVSVTIKRDTNNNCFLHPDGVFVWSKHTLAKLGSDGGSTSKVKVGCDFHVK